MSSNSRRTATAEDAPTVEDTIDSRVVHGSSRANVEKLALTRARIGPFGTLLLTMDRSGAERERASMRRPVGEVVPALRTAITWMPAGAQGDDGFPCGGE
jgi:hypothetical protein